jgi:hypothetical protein
MRDKREIIHTLVSHLYCNYGVKIYPKPAVEQGVVTPDSQNVICKKFMVGGPDMSRMAHNLQLGMVNLSETGHQQQQLAEWVTLQRATWLHYERRMLLAWLESQADHWWP